MKQQVLVVGEQRLNNEALQLALKDKGYTVTIEDSNFSKVQSHIKKGYLDFVIWDESIVGVGFKKILSITNSFLSQGNSVLILNSQMLHYMAEGLLNGIQGFIHIKSSISELDHCLHTLEKGTVFISRYLVGEQKGFFYKDLIVKREGKFTSRELDILRYVKQKKSSKQIADILNINYRTVQNQRQNMCNKLGLSGRGALYDYAIQYFNSEVIKNYEGSAKYDKRNKSELNSTG